MANKIPDFFIVGAPKCGTSAINHYLGQHPQIFMPKIKEPHYFSSDLIPPNYIRDEQLYLSLFRDVKDEMRIGEVSNTYLYSKVAARKIYQFNTSADIIMILRNPVHMMYSLFHQAIASGIEDITSFRMALYAEKERERSSSGCSITFRQYRDAARYYEQVKRYLNIFDRERVYIMIYEEFKSDNIGELQKLFQFLRVDEKFIPVINYSNLSRYPRSIFLAQFIRKVKPRKGINSNPIHRKSVNILRKLNTKHQSRPPLDETLGSQLMDEYLPEILRLEELIDKDLSIWRRYHY